MYLKNGMVGLSGGNTWIQKAIRFFTNSKYSHSFCIMYVYDIPSALETTETRVIISPVLPSKAVGQEWVEVWDVIADEDKKNLALRETYRNNSGKWYGYLSYLWFMYRWLLRKFGKEPTKMWSWVSSGVTCTELTCMYLQKLFPELFPNDLNTYSPEELRLILIANKDKFVWGGYLNWVE